MVREHRSARMLRVDHAGEYGATRIYAGQMAVMGNRAPHSGEVEHMARQEADHLRRFDAMIAERGVRPTVLQPVWRGGRLRAGCCHRADRPGSGDGLHCGDRGRDRSALHRPAG